MGYYACQPGLYPFVGGGGKRAEHTAAFKHAGSYGYISFEPAQFALHIYVGTASLLWVEPLGEVALHALKGGNYPSRVGVFAKRQSLAEHFVGTHERDNPLSGH